MLDGTDGWTYNALHSLLCITIIMRHILRNVYRIVMRLIASIFFSVDLLSMYFIVVSCGACVCVANGLFVSVTRKLQCKTTFWVHIMSTHLWFMSEINYTVVIESTWLKFESKFIQSQSKSSWLRSVYYRQHTGWLLVWKTWKWNLTVITEISGKS